MTSLAALLGALFLKPALVLAAAAAITSGLRRHAAAARHAVWAGAIMATLALPVLSVALPPLRIPTFAHALDRGPTPSTPTHLGPTLAVPGLGVGNEALTPRPSTAVQPSGRLLEAIVVLWILGAVLLGARRVVAEVRVRGIVRRGRPAANLERLCGDLRPEIRLSDETTTPAVAGVFRPVILLPTAADTWAESDLAAVLVHEAGHSARRDCLWNFCADVAAALYWCNPLVRFGVQRMRSESEIARDDRVLEGGAEPEGYAHLLLTLARLARVHGGLPLAATAMARPRELESRLLAVLDARVPRRRLPRWVPIGLAASAVVVALPAAALTLRAVPLEAAQIRAPEPDRLGDSLAAPASERLPLSSEAYRLSPGAALALTGPDSALTRRLVAALDHEPSDEADLIRERAAWALSQARDGRLVEPLIEPLIEALDARDWRVQAYAAWSLATARNPRAVPKLVSLLGAPVWRLRAMAASTLRAAGDPRAAVAMSAALLDPAWQIRVEAVEYFAALGGPTLAQRLRPRLDDRHVAVRLAAQRALTP